MPEMDQSLKWLIEKRRDDLIALALPVSEVLYVEHRPAERLAAVSSAG